MSDEFAETWRSDFRIAERGAAVCSDAGIHNSVVLAGACVEAGSMVASCVLCPGARVARRTTIRGSIVTARGAVPISE
jgi:ADP-glucose pyrophosphorylase